MGSIFVLLKYYTKNDFHTSCLNIVRCVAPCVYVCIGKSEAYRTDWLTECKKLHFNGYNISFRCFCEKPHIAYTADTHTVFVWSKLRIPFSRSLFFLSPHSKKGTFLLYTIHSFTYLLALSFAPGLIPSLHVLSSLHPNKFRFRVEFWCINIRNVQLCGSHTVHPIRAIHMLGISFLWGLVALLPFDHHVPPSTKRSDQRTYHR